MNKSRFKRCAGWRTTAAGVFCAATLAIGPAMSTEDINPEADTILNSISAYLGGTKAFSVKADIELVFDGKNLTLYGRNLNAYTQIDVSGKIHDAYPGI